MSVQTAIAGSTVNSVSGDLRMHVAKFTSVANNDTYVVPLGVIMGFNAESGSTATVGGTWVNSGNGSTLTFAIGSGPATNVTFSALGY